MLTVCGKVCSECPFSNQSLQGFLADYKPMDFLDYMRHDFLFPCHKSVDRDMAPDEVEEAVLEGALVLCRGYVESMVKSCKLPRDRQFAALVSSVKDAGVSDHTMSIHEFLTHHQLPPEIGC